MKTSAPLNPALLVLFLAGAAAMVVSISHAIQSISSGSEDARWIRGLAMGDATP